MAAEVALQNLPSLVRSKTAPQASSSRTRAGASFACSSAMRQIVQILAAAHRVGEMDAPVIAIVDVAHRRGHAAFGHHGVGFAEQRFRDHADLDAGRRSFDRRAQSRAARAD